MLVKNKIFEILNNNENVFTSGNEIAKKLNITRSAVWKAVKSIELDGYEIKSSTNKGYMLLNTNDILSKSGIEKYLNNVDFFDLIIHKSVTSTNDLLKDLASSKDMIGKEGVVVVSSEQTAGRGRFNREFYSPENTGIYFSILLRPNISNQDFKARNLVFLTSLASVSVCNAIENLLDIEPKIKWVNDIFVENKKVCGILTEASFTIENFDVDYVVLGIGINVYKSENGFPKEVSELASYLLEDKMEDLRNKLSAKILDEFYDYYSKFDVNYIAKKYKELSCVIDKEVLVMEKNEKILARVIDIDKECGLVVKFSNGDTRTLISGEISLKLASEN